MFTIELPEPFNFDSIDEKTVTRLYGRNFPSYEEGDEKNLLTCSKPKGIQPVRIKLWCERGKGKLGELTTAEQVSCYAKRGLAPCPWHLIALALHKPTHSLLIKNRYIKTIWQTDQNHFCGLDLGDWDNVNPYSWTADRLHRVLTPGIGVYRRTNSIEQVSHWLYAGIEVSS